jgi:hypothetical protein
VPVGVGAADLAEIPEEAAGTGAATLGAGAGEGEVPLLLEHAASSAAPVAATDTRAIFAQIMPLPCHAVVEV